MALYSRIVRAKENPQLSNAEPSQIQTSGTDPLMKVLCQDRSLVLSLTYREFYAFLIAKVRLFGTTNEIEIVPLKCNFKPKFHCLRIRF